MSQPHMWHQVMAPWGLSATGHPVSSCCTKARQCTAVVCRPQKSKVIVDGRVLEWSLVLQGAEHSRIRASIRVFSCTCLFRQSGGVSLLGRGRGQPFWVLLLSWRLTTCAKNNPSQVCSSVFHYCNEIPEAGELTRRKIALACSLVLWKFTQHSANSARGMMTALPWWMAPPWKGVIPVR